VLNHTLLDLQHRPSGMTLVRMTTSAGSIDIQLYTEDCPDTTGNFLKLVDDGFYDGLHFHRVLKDFMIQAGCPNSRDPNSSQCGFGNAGWKIKCEPSALAKKHDRPGLLSMGNQGRPHTGSSQFFLTTVPTPWLDGGHAIFGEVIEGMENVYRIGNCDTKDGGMPYDPQKIIKVERV